MRLRFEALGERVRASLFFVPMLGVLGAIALGALSLAVDRHLGPGTDLPLGLTSTVLSARALLSTIAGATISFAGIAFSVSLLIIQQASNQHSPRIVHTLFRDPFNKRVLGLVVGTFTYCVVVLRSVRTAVEDAGDPVVPNISVGLASVLGIVTILAVVAFIDHSAHSMDVSEILHRVRREAVDHILATWRDAGQAEDHEEVAMPVAEAATTLRFSQSGWIQQIDTDGLLRCLPPGSTLRLGVHPGIYAIAGTAVATVSPAPDDIDSVEHAVNGAVSTGSTRTMQQDASYGLRQLADVALKALSPGVNDPTTAEDAILHSTAVLAELLRRDPPVDLVTRWEDRVLVMESHPSHADLVRLSYAEIRRAADGQPAVSIYLLDAMGRLRESLHAAGLAERAEPLAEQASLVMTGARHQELPAEDRREVARAYERGFGETLRP